GHVRRAEGSDRWRGAGDARRRSGRGGRGRRGALGHRHRTPAGRREDRDDQDPGGNRGREPARGRGSPSRRCERQDRGSGPAPTDAGRRVPVLDGPRRRGAPDRRRRRGAGGRTAASTIPRSRGVSATTTERTRPTVAGSRLTWAVQDSLVVMRRNLLRFVRIPALFVFSIVQPIMFVLLF